LRRTVGRPLPGIDVYIDDGEIVVHGPSVVERYLHGLPAEGVWRTGDVGEIDRDGYLAVRGRRDNLLVTPMGRNISPEWIESLVACDPRVASCLVALVQGHVTAVLIPSEDGEEWFARASIDAIGDLIVATMTFTLLTNVNKCGTRQISRPMAPDREPSA
jgi:long-subunit acyl-CoA synthetase (AMP-forming)